MSNSNLISYTRISPNKTSPRNHAIDTLTIHCYVGQVPVESMGEWFEKTDTKASANYGIGTDGRIGMFVEEKDRSWCSSNAENDHRAITIECACDKTDPYAINDKVYASLIDLCTDICKRNNIKELKWKADKSLIGQVDKQNMTVHRWFKNKACPGDYIYERLGQIAAEVNARLGSGSSNQSEPTHSVAFPATPFEVKVIVDDLNYRSEPAMGDNVKGQTGKGVFTIVAVEGKWGKLKSGAGWIYLGNSDYCKILSTVAEPAPQPVSKPDGKVPFEVDVTIGNLNIRTGPGKNYAATGHKTGRGRFTIMEVKGGPGSEAGWGRLKSGAGWIALDYATRV